jgi:hypothetical protein
LTGDKNTNIYYRIFLQVIGLHFKVRIRPRKVIVGLGVALKGVVWVRGQG